MPLLLLRSQPETAVLVLTVNEEDELVLDAVRAGSSAYRKLDIETREQLPAALTDS